MLPKVQISYLYHYLICLMLQLIYGSSVKVRLSYALHFTYQSCNVSNPKNAYAKVENFARNTGLYCLKQSNSVHIKSQKETPCAAPFLEQLLS